MNHDGQNKQIPVIIDCDTGIDDMISFVLTLADERLHILGITTVAGNQKVEFTTYNTLNGLALMGREEIPVARGEAQPIERPLKDAGYIHGETGLGTYHFAHPTEKTVVEEDGVSFLYRLLTEAEEKVTILALAPLTNIARLYIDHPDCKGKIDKIIFMGGSIRTGNPTPVSTFNVLADPEGARAVIKGGVPFNMCPLDTTKDAYITDEEIESIKEIGNPVADMVYELCHFYNDTVIKSNNALQRFKGLCIHDLCTAAYLTNPEFFTTRNYYGDVETKGELTTGFTMIDYEDILMKPEAEKNITYIDSVDREGVMRVFFEAMKTYGK